MRKGTGQPGRAGADHAEDLPGTRRAHRRVVGALHPPPSAETHGRQTVAIRQQALLDVRGGRSTAVGRKAEPSLRPAITPRHDGSRFRRSAIVVGVTRDNLYAGQSRCNPAVSSAARTAGERPGRRWHTRDEPRQLDIHPISGQPRRPVLIGPITLRSSTRFQKIPIDTHVCSYIRFCRVRLSYPGEITSSSETGCGWAPMYLM